MENNLAIKITNVSKTYKLRSTKVKTIRERVTNLVAGKYIENDKIVALKNINLYINQGESFGIIGKNGSGKSTLINIIMETIKPDIGGNIDVYGKVMRLALGLGIDANLSARDNIYVNGSIIGLSFRKIGTIFDQIIEFAGIPDFVDTPVKFYSKGMKQRLMFSIAMHANADIFLLDEFFGGTGDQEFRIKSDIAFKKRILNGKTNVIVSHSLQTIRKHCERALWIHKGKILLIDDVDTVIKAYMKFIKSNK